MGWFELRYNVKIDWRSRLLKIWHDFVKPVAVILFVVGSFRSAVADWNDVPTGSMKPVILEGDRIFVNKLAYDLRLPFTDWRLAIWSKPLRGDVVVFFSPEEGGVRMVKRVVGLPGDTIELKNNRLLINSAPVEYGPLDQSFAEVIGLDQVEEYVFSEEQLGDRKHPIMTMPLRPSRRNFRPVTLPDDQYFMMGDNRDFSRDSRWFGFVNSTQIVGRAIGIAMSLDPDHYYLPRWGRFFHELP
jgi:signal peptidase I